MQKKSAQHWGPDSDYVLSMPNSPQVTGSESCADMLYFPEKKQVFNAVGAAQVYTLNRQMTSWHLRRQDSCTLIFKGKFFFLVFPHSNFPHIDLPQYFHCHIHQVAWFIGSKLREKQRPLPEQVWLSHTPQQFFTRIRFWRYSPARLDSQSPAIPIKKTQRNIIILDVCGAHVNHAAEKMLGNYRNN